MVQYEPQATGTVKKGLGEDDFLLGVGAGTNRDGQVNHHGDAALHGSQRLAVPQAHLRDLPDGLTAPVSLQPNKSHVAGVSLN